MTAAVGVAAVGAKARAEAVAKAVATAAGRTVERRVRMAVVVVRVAHGRVGLRGGRKERRVVRIVVDAARRLVGGVLLAGRVAGRPMRRRPTMMDGR